jgi:hypothetical protein
MARFRWPALLLGPYFDDTRRPDLGEARPLGGASILSAAHAEERIQTK